MKFLFLPVSIIGGLLAGLIGKKIFAQIWGLIDEQEPPEPQNRQVGYAKLAGALLLEGAIFRFARGFFNHGARHGFQRLTARGLARKPRSRSRSIEGWLPGRLADTPTDVGGEPCS